MKCFDWTCPAPAEDMACDEALLDAAEDSRLGEVLRFYEPRDYFVVLGYGNRARTETRWDACRREGIPVLRRCSGGGTVLQGPGCLSYALVLAADQPETASISDANRFIMGRHRRVIQGLVGGEVLTQGHTDLTWNGLKFSGNAQRRKRRFLLFHGTFLYSFDLSRMDQCLAMPSTEPDYRQHRPHSEFLVNLPVVAEALKDTLRAAWRADESLVAPPDWNGLVASRYGLEEWNQRF
jgi:lipoate-protein ligase A